MIYIAHPYWHDDEAVRAARIEATAAVAKALLDRQLLAVAPCLFIGRLDAAERARRDLWTHWSLHILQRVASSVLVLPYDGWQESDGLKRALLVARLLGLPIYSPAAHTLDRPEIGSVAWYGGPAFIDYINSL